MSDDITKPRQEYLDAAENLEINRLAIGGARPVRAAGLKCLAPLASMKATTTYNEDSQRSMTTYSSELTSAGREAYAEYLSNAVFIGFTGQTVTGLKGLIKSKPAVPVIPKALDFLIDDIDGAGTALETLADNCVSEAFPSTKQLLLITAPETDGTNSKRDDEINNIRAKVAHYDQGSIINWHTEVINNKKQYVMIVLKEAITIRDGFEIKVEAQYRHLALIDGVYQQELRDKNNIIISPMAPVILNGSTIDRIPARFGRTGHSGKSVIDDLVDANLEHYNIYADYGNLRHISSFPVFYETGVNEPGTSANVSVGPGVKWDLATGETAGVIQADANKCPQDKALKDTENRLSNLGADMLKETSTAASGDAKRLDKVSTNSTTIDLANTISRMITETLQDIAEIWNVAGEISYTLNTDYDPTRLDYQMITAIGDIWDRGLIDKEEAQHSLKQGEVIRHDRDLDEMNKNIDSEESGLSKGDE